MSAASRCRRCGSPVAGDGLTAPCPTCHPPAEQVTFAQPSERAGTLLGKTVRKRRGTRTGPVVAVADGGTRCFVRFDGERWPEGVPSEQLEVVTEER